MSTYAPGMHRHPGPEHFFSRDHSVDFLMSARIVPCPWVFMFSLVVLAALRVPLAVTWFTVYRQLQIGRRVGRDTYVVKRPVA